MENIIDELLTKPFSTRPYETQLKIIQEGKPCPALPKLILSCRTKSGDYTRRFATTHYESVEWLTGCEKRSKLFCWPCLLFSNDRDNVWNQQGFCDLVHLTTSNQKHERSVPHIQAALSLKMFESHLINTGIDHQQVTESNRHNEKVKKNRELFKRFIDVICCLTKQDLPLRHDNETSGSVNKGNYLEYLNILRNYDSLLNDHFSLEDAFQGTLPSVQDDMVKAIANVVKDSIKKEVISVTFVALVLEETSDVTSKSQLATILRFVCGGKMHERFIGFTDVSSDRINALFNHITNIVQEYQISKLVAITYNKACATNASMKELQKKVNDTFSFALYAHHYSHNLDLVSVKSHLNIKECVHFFNILCKLGEYLSNSLQRLSAFQEFTTNTLAADIKWNFTSELISTVHQFRSSLIDFLKHTTENPEKWDSNDLITSRGFVSFLQDFRTVLLLEIFANLVPHTNALSKLFKNTDYDISKYREEINETKEQLQYIKNKFYEELWTIAVSRMNEDLSHIDKKPRLNQFEEDKESYFQLFITILDSTCFEIDNRVAYYPKIHFVELLNHKKYDNYIKQFPDNLMELVKNSYEPFFDFPRLKNELKVLYVSPEFSNKDITKLMAIINEYDMRNIFKEVFKLAELILTMPCCPEQPVSSIEQIHCRYPGSQVQERLYDLSLLLIETNLVTELKKKSSFYDDVLEQFLLKQRRSELIYK